MAASWLLDSFTLLTLDSRGHVSLYTTGRTGRAEGQGHRGAVCPNPQEQPTLLPYYVQIITYSKYPGRLSVLQSAGFLRKCCFINSHMKFTLLLDTILKIAACIS